MPKSILTTDNVEQGSTSGTASAGLTIPKTLYDRLIASVRKNLVWRPLAAVAIGPGEIKGSSVDVPIVKEGESSLEVYEVAEGADLPTNVVEYTDLNLKPKKYAVRIPITSEMLEDGYFSLLQQNVDTAGYKMAKKVDKLIINAVDAGAGNTVSGGATISINNITTAMQYLEASDYAATDMIIGVAVANDIRNIDTFVEADKAGITDPSQSLIGKIFGMNVWVSNNQTSTTAYVIDRSHAFVVAEKRAITINQWDDLVRDSRQASATMRFTAGVLRANSIAKITTS